MNSRQRHLVLFALLALAWLGRNTCSAETSSEAYAASVLFKQFETVAYTRFDLLASSEVHDSKSIDSENDMRFPFLELLAGLRILDPNTMNDLESSYSGVLVGAKNFAGPQGLGVFSSDECYIAVSKSGSRPDVARDFSHATHESIEGRQVWTWSMPPFEGYPRSTNFYAAQIAGSYFVIANNLQDFKEAVRALTVAASTKLAPTDIFGWATFSTHKYWAYRLVRRTGTISVASGIKEMSDVIALTFFADVDKGESFVRVLSSDTSMKTKPQVLPESELNLLQPLGTGIWQARIPLSKDEVQDDPLFQVFYHFGFGLVL